MTAPSLPEFILAREGEWRAAAEAASPGGWTYGTVESVAGGLLYDESRTIASLVYEQPGDHDGRIVRHLLVPEADANGVHIAMHDPASVLRQCDAIRRMVRRSQAAESAMTDVPDDQSYFIRMSNRDGWRLALRDLAAIWSDHEDFRAEWAA